MFGRVESVRREDLPERGLDVVSAVAESARDTLHRGRVGLGGDEFTPELFRDVLRGPRMSQQNLEHIVAVERPAPRQDGFLPLVVLRGPEQELAPVRVDAPARESARRLL